MKRAAGLLGVLLMVMNAHAKDVLITVDDLPIAGKKLELYVRTDDFQAAAALSPGFNRTWHEVDFTKAKVSNEAVDGPMTITIASDGWNPKEPQTLGLQVVADLKAGTVAVKQNDKTLNATLKELQTPDSGRVTFDCQNILSLDKPGKTHWATLAMAVTKTKVESPRIEPHGSLTDTSFAVLIDGYSLVTQRRGIGGSLNAKIRPQGGELKDADLSLQSFAIGPRLFGTVTQREGGKNLGSGRAVGLIEASVVPDNAIVTLTLHDAVAPGGYLKLHLATKDRRVVAAFGTTPNFNNATHTVDASGLKLEGDQLTGPVSITVNPDPWQPKDGKAISGTINLNARAVQGEWSGGFSFDTRVPAGRINGTTDAKPELKPTAITLKLENALVGGNEWSNRVFMSFQVDGEKITGGKISNNHTKLAGTVDGGTVKITETTLAAMPAITVTAGGKAVSYTFDVQGVVVGKWAAGTFTTFVDGKKAKTGTFWAGLAK